MPEDGLVCLDNGMYKIWFARNYRTHVANTLLLDNALATMGAGLPSAMMAAMLYPERRVLAVAGDGGFMMNSQEMETAVRLKLNLVVLVLEDNAYGMIRWKQAVDKFPDFGLGFGNPDFVKYAELVRRQGPARRQRRWPGARAGGGVQGWRRAAGGGAGGLQRECPRAGGRAREKCRLMRARAWRAGNVPLATTALWSARTTGWWSVPPSGAGAGAGAGAGVAGSVVAAGAAVSCVPVPASLFVKMNTNTAASTTRPPTMK